MRGAAAMFGWCLAIAGAWLVAAAYWFGVWVFAIAGVTVGGMGGLVVFTAWGNSPASAPDWYCRSCKVGVHEPEYRQDPYDEAGYCPRCDHVLEVRP